MEAAPAGADAAAAGEPTNATDIATMEDKNRRTYVLEENMYGLLLMPDRPLHVGAYLVLIVNYLLIGALSAAIFQATRQDYEEFQFDLSDNVDGLCKKVGIEFDCTPPLLHKFQDFSSLDADSDGMWSVLEARQSQLLPRFVALHEIALESKDFLGLFITPQQAEPEFFCSATINAVIADRWSENASFQFLFEAWTDFESKGIVRRLLEEDDCHSFGEIEGNASHSVNMLAMAYCKRKLLCDSGALPGKPFVSSRSRYMEMTRTMSLFTSDLYQKLLHNLLEPCRIVLPDLCGNAEVDGKLGSVPIWALLFPGERIERCKVHVQNICPRLLGDKYMLFATRAFKNGGTCGDPSWHAAELVFKKTTTVESSQECTDDNAALQSTFRALAASTVVMSGFVRTYASQGELPQTCSQIAGMNDGLERWCEMSQVIVDTEDDNRTAFIGELIGRACPATCCASSGWKPAWGCPKQCFAKHHPQSQLTNVKSELGETRCFGTNCQQDFMSSDPVTGNIKLKPGVDGFNEEDRLKFVIDAQRPLRAYIVSLTIGDGRPDLHCARDALIVAGTRICDSNQHAYPHVDLRAGLQEIFFLSETGCKSKADRRCGWQIDIIDAGVSESLMFHTVSFDAPQTYGPARGTLHWWFVAFFFLMTVLWFIYLSPELGNTLSMAMFILEGPMGISSRRRLLHLLILLVPRFVIWLWVLMFGYFLFITAPAFLDIVLNSMVLGFIIDIDEITYGMAVPTKIKQMVANHETFEWNTKKAWNTSAENTVVLRLGILVAAVTSASLVQYFRINGFIDTSAALDCLCLMKGDRCLSAL